jgi:hypothetical protein
MVIMNLYTPPILTQSKICLTVLFILGSFLPEGKEKGPKLAFPFWLYNFGGV